MSFLDLATSNYPKPIATSLVTSDNQNHVEHDEGPRSSFGQKDQFKNFAIVFNIN